MNTFGLGLILNFTDNASSGLRNATGAFNELSSSVDAFSSANGAEAALLQVSAAAGIVGNELYNVGRNITSLFAGVISSVNETGSSIASARSQLSTLYGSDSAGQSVLNQIKEYAAESIFNFEDLIPSVIMLKANGIEAFDEIATSAYRATNGIEGNAQTLMDYAADLAAFNPQMHNMYGTGVQAAMGALNEYIAEGNTTSLKRGASLDILQLLDEEKGKTIEERSRQVADLIEQLGMVGMTRNLRDTPMQRLSNVSDVFFNLLTEISDSGVFEKYTKLVEKFTDYLFKIPDEEMTQIAQIIAEALVDIMEPLEKVLDLGIQLVDWLRDLVKQNPELTKTIIKMTAFAGALLLVSGAALKLLSALGMLKFSLSMLFKGNTMTMGARILGLFKNFALYILPIIATVALLKEAWDRDFMGMQERLKNFVKETIDTFKILFDAWGDYALSEENFERAKELGILPLVEAILQLKYHLGFLIDGFKKGFNAFFDTLGKILTKMGILDKETHGFRDLVVKLLEKITAPGLTDNWEKFGYVLGQAVGWLFLILAILPTVLKFIKLIIGAVRIVTTVGSVIIRAITTIFNLLRTVIPFILNGIGSIVIAILGAFGVVVTLPAWLVGLITLAIAALIALVWHFRDEIAAFLVELWYKVSGFFKDLWPEIKNTLQKFWDWFSNTKVGEFIINLVKSIFNFIKTVYESLVKLVTSLIGLVVNIAKLIYEVIRVAVYGIIGLFQALGSKIYDILHAIGNFFSDLFTSLYNDIVVPFTEFLGEAAEWVKSNVFEPLGEFIGGLFEKLSDKLHWLYDNVVVPVFNGIKDFICGVVQAIADFVSPIIDAISEAIGSLAEGLSNVIDGVSGFVGGAADWVGEKADSLQRMIGLSTGGYVKTTGIAVLHPNEVVVNDVLTKNLAGFLQDYKDTKKSPISENNTTNTIIKESVINNNESVTNSITKEQISKKELTLLNKLVGVIQNFEKNKEETSPLVTMDIIVTDDYSEREDKPTPVVPVTPNGDTTNTENNYYDTNTETYNNTNTTDNVTNNTTTNETGSPMQTFVNNSTSTTNNNTTDNKSGDDYSDNSVVFESGSIVFNVDKSTDLANMSEDELNAVAEKLMRIMARKMQLRNMQTRK